MKKFEEAELEVMTFENDVITTSGNCPPDLKINPDPPAPCADCDGDCDRDWM